MNLKKMYAATLIYCCFSTYTNSQTPGCTDVLATNYNSVATQNDGSCTYPETIILPDTSIVLPEIMSGTSGLLNYGNKIMTHNDHIDSNLYVFPPFQPNNYQTFPLKGIIPEDAEELAQDETYVYFGDFGNNATGNRTNLKIYRLKKSEIENYAEPEIIAFSYDNQTDFSPTAGNATDFDCEAFIVGDEKIFLFTKEWNQQGTSVYELEKTPGTHTAVFKTHFDINGLITGATYLKEKNMVVLSGYSVFLKPFVYLLYDFQGNDFFGGNKRKIILDLPFHQVEGITTEDGLHYFITNEKFSANNAVIEPKIHSLDLSPYLSLFLNGDLSVSQHENKSAMLKIYPNPAKDKAYFLLPEISDGKKYYLKIIDATGKTVLEKNISKNKTELDLSSHHLKGSYKILLLNEM